MDAATVDARDDEETWTTDRPIVPSMKAAAGILLSCGLVLAASACGSSPGRSGARATSEASTTTLAQKDFAGLVDIGGGRQIWATCKGQGSPTVVLISGHGNGAEDWSLTLDPDDPVHQTPGDDVSAGMGKLVASDDAVLPSVARTTRVCTYDRSDIRFTGEVTTPRPQPHTADLDVSDLHSLLAAIGEEGPYVFASHSYGGLVSTLYARTYPDSIAGLVMVDTVSEVMEDLVSSGRARLVGRGERGDQRRGPRGGHDQGRLRTDQRLGADAEGARDRPRGRQAVSNRPDPAGAAPRRAHDVRRLGGHGQQAGHQPRCEDDHQDRQRPQHLPLQPEARHRLDRRDRRRRAHDQRWLVR